MSTQLTKGYVSFLFFCLGAREKKKGGNHWSISFKIYFRHYFCITLSGIKNGKFSYSVPSESNELQQPHDPGRQHWDHQVEGADTHPDAALEVFLVGSIVPVALVQNGPTFSEKGKIKIDILFCLPSKHKWQAETHLSFFLRNLKIFSRLIDLFAFTWID